jgi:hypothetical protein
MGECFNHVQPQFQILSEHCSNDMKMMKRARKRCNFPVNVAWYALSHRRYGDFYEMTLIKKLWFAWGDTIKKKHRSKCPFHHEKLHLFDIYHHVSVNIFYYDDAKHSMFFDLLNFWVRCK